MNKIDQYDKLVLKIAKTVRNNKKPTDKFKFDLVRLLVKDAPENKIQNAYDNRKVWDANNIQNLSLNALQSMFFTVIEIIKEHKPSDPSADYCIREKHIEAVLTGYLEDKEELQNEIEELENKLDGKGMISKKDHSEEMNAILEENKQLKKELEIQRVKTESRDKYWTDKMEYRKKAHDKEKEYFNTELEKIKASS